MPRPSRDARSVTHWLRSPLPPSVLAIFWRVLASIAVFLVGWALQGAMGLLLLSPAIGAIWATILADAAANGWSSLWRSGRRIEGAVHAWRGHSLRVIQDAVKPGQAAFSWVMLDDTRRAGLQWPSDARLRARLPTEHWRWIEDGPGPAGLALRADVLADNLRMSQQFDSRNFARWLEVVVLKRVAARSQAPDTVPDERVDKQVSFEARSGRDEAVRPTAVAGKLPKTPKPSIDNLWDSAMDEQFAPRRRSAQAKGRQPFAPDTSPLDFAPTDPRLGA